MAGALIERVSKLDAARRQIRTAIRLFFEDGDTVSIHTLTSAAEELLRDFLIDAGKKSPIRESFRQLESGGVGHVAALAELLETAFSPSSDAAARRDAI